MESIILAFEKFINLTPRQKVNLFYALIICGLCYVVYSRENYHELNYKDLKNDYNILGSRCDSVSFFYQKKFDTFQEGKIMELQEKNRKLQEISEKYNQIKNEIE